MCFPWVKGKAGPVANGASRFKLMVLTSMSREDHWKLGFLMMAHNMELMSRIKSLKQDEFTESRGPVLSKSVPKTIEEESLRGPPLGHFAMEISL